MFDNVRKKSDARGAPRIFSLVGEPVFKEGQPVNLLTNFYLSRLKPFLLFLRNNFIFAINIRYISFISSNVIF
jgi:hypothetical protein